MKRVNGGVWVAGRIFLFAVLGLGLLVVQPASLAKKKGPYELKFGLMMMGGDGKPMVYTETRYVEKHIDPSYVHGFSVARRDRGQFMAYYKVRFPAPLKEITDSMRQYYTITENGRVIESPEKMHRAVYTEHFSFSESDPTGTYIMEIYIDGDLYKKIEYEVLPVDEIGLPF